ncbi:MAG: DUF5674 family protein [Candidatus Staskawiczbacteria bacterium]|nr:DUF5674 family protein [Candidatus Staskawiczbacteria bacterium]
MFEIKIIKDKLPKEELEEIAKNNFGEMVKAMVDIDKKIFAVGGELHADAMERIVEDGSNPNNTWGINIYPNKPEIEWIEFNSLMNIRPGQNNFSLEVENPEIREKIRKIIKDLIV